MSLAPGTRLRRYEVRSPLGAGGMGEVFLARDVELERTIALKILPRDAAESTERIHRFVQEARAACALNHPNAAHIYEIGEEDGVRFIAMEYVEGETLRVRMARSPMPVDEALDVAIQIASALASAHAAGVVHRDIKPENVVLRPDGYVKVLDFGLAKLVGTRAEDAKTEIVKTETGVVMGTVQYMAPEQLRGEEVDARADLFSLGVVLYEMIAGRRPFEGSSPGSTIAAILTENPRPLEDPALQEVVAKALARKPEARYPSARALLDDLKRLRGGSQPRVIRSGDVATEILTPPPARRRSGLRAAVLGLAALIVLAGGGWAVWHARRIAAARAAVPEIIRLAEEHRYATAYDRAMAIRPLIPEDSRLAGVISEVSTTLRVTSEPPGARVFLQRYVPPTEHADEAPRVAAGTTPVETTVARADYLVTIEKDGFAPVTRVISALPIFVQGMKVDTGPPKVEERLLRAADVPPGMSWVPPSRQYRLAGWLRSSDRAINLAGFFVDQHEVSNREFAEFVDQGGYRRRELWKEPFVKDGKPLPFEQAMALFRDTTGLPAPRSWAGGKYPEGRGDYPVADITWYEAAAYAELRGKKLPTVFQWDKAARNGLTSAFGLVLPWGVAGDGVDIMGRTNFRGVGPMPVDSMPFGMSWCGAQHMAGNVAEWTRNAHGDGFSTMGASWDSPVYQFGDIGAYPGFYTSPRLGFRCVKESPGTAGDQGGVALKEEPEVPLLRPVDDAAFQEIRARYDYAKAPLKASVTERRDSEAWTRERIVFDTPEGRKVIAYLYLPKSVRRPLQVIHFVPSADVTRGIRSLPEAIEQLLGPMIRAGRAVFGVVLQGYIERERPPGFVYPRSDEPEYVDLAVADVVDIRRALDYLETRPDIDASRIGFVGASSGAHTGLPVTALDPRYRSVLFAGTGVYPNDRNGQPAVNRINFAPRVRAPKLILAGRYDESHPLRTDVEPLFALFPQPKRLVVYDGGHIPALEIFVKTVNGWLDESLGRVE